MEKLTNAIKEITKHGETLPPVKSIKVKDGDTKMKVKFSKDSKRAKAIEKARKSHSVAH